MEKAITKGGGRYKVSVSWKTKIKFEEIELSLIEVSHTLGGPGEGRVEGSLREVERALMIL
jgi:hypothetical protein